jgi:surface carbohydrate biosynthesis protein
MVLNKLSKIKSFLAYFLSAKRTWTLPRKSEVLIFDAAGKDILMPYLSSWNPEVLHVRNEVICMPVLFASFFRKGKRLVVYADCYIEYVSPRMVITHIDNNPNFYLLSGKHPGIKTVFLQNGLRSYYLDIFEMLDLPEFMNAKLHVDHMLTFGEAVGREYRKKITGRCTSIGSVKNNSISRKTIKRKNSIVFISQFRSDQSLLIDGTLVDRTVYFESADRAVVSFLKEYAKQTGRSFYIATYNMDSPAQMQELEKEKRYYDAIAGSPIEYIVRESPVSSYKVMDEAGVGVSIDSSLAYESAARGNKTAFFCIRGSFLKKKGYDFGWPALFPLHGNFWTNIPDWTLFTEIMDYLFSIDSTQWQKDISGDFLKEIMTFDPSNRIVNDLVHQILGKPSSKVSVN